MKVKDIISKDYIKVDVNDFLSKFIGKAIKYPDDDALVFDKKQFKGVLKRQWLLESKVDSSKTKVKKFVTHVSVLDLGGDIKEAAKLMYASDSRLLPVKQKDQIIGVVKAKDIIKIIKGKGKAEQVGSRKIIVLNENERYGNAINIMKEKKVGHVPVVDDKGEFIGVVTLKDWMKKYLVWPKNSDFGVRESGTKSKSGTRAYKEKNNMLDLPVQNNMRIYGLVTASPNASVREIVDLMVEEEVPSVILVNENKPVGIVTIRDLLRLFVTKD